MFGKKSYVRERTRYDIGAELEAAVKFQAKTLDERDAQEKAVEELKAELVEFDKASIARKGGKLVSIKRADRLRTCREADLDWYEGEGWEKTAARQKKKPAPAKGEIPVIPSKATTKKAASKD